MNEQLIDTKEVCRRTCLSRTAIWTLERENGTFPRATRIGRAVRWRAADIDAWIRERTAPQADGDPGSPTQTGENAAHGAPAPSGDVPPAGA